MYRLNDPSKKSLKKNSWSTDLWWPFVNLVSFHITGKPEVTDFTHSLPVQQDVASGKVTMNYLYRKKDNFSLSANCTSDFFTSTQKV